MIEREGGQPDVVPDIDFVLQRNNRAARPFIALFWAHKLDQVSIQADRIRPANSPSELQH